MNAPAAPLTIPDLDETTLRFVAERSRDLHFDGPADYLRSLIREDRLRAERELRRSSLEDIVAPLHAHAEAQGYTDADLDAMISQARAEVADLDPR